MPRIAMMITVLNLAGNILLIPAFASTGAALAATLSYSLGGAIIVWRFASVSGMGWREILVPRASDFVVVRDSLRRMTHRSERSEG